MSRFKKKQTKQSYCKVTGATNTLFKTFHKCVACSNKLLLFSLCVIYKLTNARKMYNKAKNKTELGR